MPKVYISGALSNLKNPEEIKGFYEAIAETCVQYGFTPHVPHLFSDPINNPDLSPREVFQNDKSLVMETNLVIAYVGLPSLGVGMELAYADIANVPVILLYEKDQYVSRFPRGIPSLVDEIPFDDYSDALIKLSSLLQSFSNRTWRDKSARILHRSLKEADVMNEIHIEEIPDSKRGITRFIIKDGSDKPILIIEALLGDEAFLRQELTNLAYQEVQPKKIYVEPFSKIGQTIRLVWPNAEVLQTYRD